MTMNTDRREFLKQAGLAGLGLTGAAISAGAASVGPKASPGLPDRPGRRSRENFNMTGFAAPKLDKVRVGNIGNGSRGSTVINRLLRLEGTEIKAVCDIVREKAETAAGKVTQAGFAAPTIYTGGEDEWKKVCERDDIDLIYISTPWELHAPIATYAMNHGKHAVMDVPAAITVENCWLLVETAERTRRHCMMASNVSYDFFELLTLNLARQGFFGEIFHGEGAYFDGWPFGPSMKKKIWRIEENIRRNGNLYPTHGAAPVCQAMNVNCGDRLDYLVAMSSDDFSMRADIHKGAETDPYWKPYAAETEQTGYRGNINTSIIRTVKGHTLMMQHDVTTLQPYSRIHKLVGTKAMALKYPLPPRIAVTHKDFISPAEFKALEDKFTPEIVRRMGDMAKQVGGHGGMDFLMDWRLIDCLRNGLPLDISVYDSVTWSVIGPLTEWSVAHRSNSIDVPDFTSGNWKTNPPGMDINLKRAGTTKALS